MAKGAFSQLHYVAPVAAFAVLLAGCSGGDTATPAATPSVTVSASSSAPADRESPAPSEASPTWDTSGPSFGVDQVQWPATAEGAYKLMKSLPKTLGGEPLQLIFQRGGEGESGPEAIAAYGDNVAGLTVAEEFMTSDTESGEPELFSADAQLAASFGLVFACAKKSYRGTIKPLEGGYGPGYGSSKKSSKPMWFSCKIDGAEGDDNFKGHAVGWTSKKAAWLVIAKDEKTARSLISGLYSPTK
jgi:hypothetical protein